MVITNAAFIHKVRSTRHNVHMCVGNSTVVWEEGEGGGGGEGEEARGREGEGGGGEGEGGREGRGKRGGGGIFMLPEMVDVYGYQSAVQIG